MSCRGKSSYKGPEVGMHLDSLRNSKRLVRLEPGEWECGGVQNGEERGQGQSVGGPGAGEQMVRRDARESS